jgi:hypothetical protein
MTCVPQIQMYEVTRMPTARVWRWDKPGYTTRMRWIDGKVSKIAYKIIYSFSLYTHNTEAWDVVLPGPETAEGQCNVLALA